MRALATNLTPAYDLQISGAELRGLKGEPIWDYVTSIRHGNHVTGAILPATIPIEISVTCVLDRERLPPGPVRARMVIRDHLGQEHKSPKINFLDGANPPGSAPGGSG
jgi:hypothetical protein